MRQTLIVGYADLAQALGPWKPTGALRAVDHRGGLPLTRLWHEGKRAFDAVEVAAFRDHLAKHNYQLPRRSRK